MAIDVETPGSPGYRLQRLARKLEEEQTRLVPIFQRYENTQPLPDTLRNAPETARQFFEAARTGYAETVVRAVKYPLRLQSFGTAADSSGDGDSEAHRLAKRSGLLTEVDDVHRVALVAGNAYAIVAVDPSTEEPFYTAEDPRQCATMHDPIRQSVVTEGLKAFHHVDEQRDFWYLYTRSTADEPAKVYRAYRDRRGRKSQPGVIRFSAASLDWDPEYGGADGQELPEAYGGRVPIFRYRNEEGVGEFERHLGLLNRIDHMVLQGMVIATMQAFKQRAIKAAPEDLPDQDEDGKDIDYDDIFAAGPDALWKLPETAEIWESGNVDLTPVWTGLDRFERQFSAVTFTPLAVFSPDGQNQSAEGASFAREGRTFKVEDRQDRFGAVHAEALSLLFRLAGDGEREPVEDITVQWRPAERYSLAEKGDAMVKYQQAGVPWRTRMIEVGQFSPAQVTQMETERASDAMLYPDTTQLPETTPPATPAPAEEPPVPAAEA